MLNKPSTKNIESAEIIALQALDFLAQEPDRLGRFVALTGIGPAQLRAEAGTPAILAAVLDHLLGDESLLLVFTSLHTLSPDSIAPAREALSNAADNR